jgi:hypothetical protein
MKSMLLILISLLGFLTAGESMWPTFVEHTIASDLKGGYQVVVADLNRDGKPDLIALASGMPELVWYENPAWTRHVIAGNLSQMINLVVLDSSPNPIIVLASGFSNEAKQSPGVISVLEPDGDILRPWKVREIDRFPTSHRLRLADIDGSGKPVVVNAPLTGAAAEGPDYRGHTPLIFYRPGEWKRRLIAEEIEGVMHGIFVIDWDGDRRDEILTASFVGIHLYKIAPDGSWTRTELAKGDPAPWPKCGSSDVAVGTLSKSRFLCSIEPWHGNQVAVYRAETDGWSRTVIDDSYIDGHTIHTADLNGDDRDEIIAGYRGKGGGLFIYRAEDAEGSRWTRRTLGAGGIAAASCAVADLNGDGKPDIACIGSATANLKWYENR